MSSAELDKSVKWVATIATGVFIGRCLTVFSGPVLLMAILFGALLGALGILLAASIVFHKITRLPPPPAIDSDRFHYRVRQLSTGGRDVTVGGPTLPAPFALHGKYAGIIFTTSIQHWGHDQYIEDWPPKGATFTAWQASISGGTLVLDLLPPKLEREKHKHKHDKGHHHQAAAREVAHVWEPRKLGIPLEGCSVELVKECLYGRSEMNRRCPLFISHPQWPLLDGEQGFYFFAHDFAAKQQWYHALQFWCVGGEKFKQLEQEYTRYCLAMKEVTVLPFAREASLAVNNNNNHDTSHNTSAINNNHSSHPVSNSGTSNINPTLRSPSKEPRHTFAHHQHQHASDSSGKKTWKAWGSARMKAAKEQYTAWKEQPHHSGARTHETASTSGAQQVIGSAPGGRPTVDIDSIIEQRWMQSRKIPVPSVPKKKKTATGEVSVPSSPVKLPLAPQHPATITSATTDTASGFTTPRDSLIRQPLAAPTAQTTSSPTKVATSGGASVPSSPTQPAAPVAPTSTTAAVGVGVGTGGSGFTPAFNELPAMLPPPVSIDHSVNTFLTRIGFDLLRSPAFQEYLRTRIQRNLGRLKTPDYVQALEVISVNAGTTAPTVKNIAALPIPDGTVWPQVLFDFKYQGSFSITIGCKVDIRDAPAWNALDRAISRVEGTRKKHTSRSASNPELSAGEDWEGVDNASDDDGGEVNINGMHDNDGDDDVASETTEASSTAGAGAENKTGGRALLDTLRQSTANHLRKLAETTATHIAKMPLKVDLTFSLLEGTMCVWLPPPPGDRMFYAFLNEPKIEIKARPQMSGRLLKFSYHASRASQWIEARMALAFTKNMVYPAGGDIPLPLLFDSDNPYVAEQLVSRPAHSPRAVDAGPHLQQQQPGAGGSTSSSDVKASASPTAAAAAGSKDGESGGSQGTSSQPGSPSTVGVNSQSAGSSPTKRIDVQRNVNSRTEEQVVEPKPFLQVQLRKPNAQQH